MDKTPKPGKWHVRARTLQSGSPSGRTNRTCVWRSGNFLSGTLRVLPPKEVASPVDQSVAVNCLGTQALKSAAWRFHRKVSICYDLLG